MSLLKWTADKSTYTYHLLKKPHKAYVNDTMDTLSYDLFTVKIKVEDQKYIHEIKGRMTNEAPAKYIIDKLNNDYNQRLDRIVMICSDKARLKKINDDGFPCTEAQKEAFQAEHTNILNKEKSIFDLTHKEYFERVITAFSETINPCYKDTKIDFKETSITDFSNESDVIKAVIDSANKVMKDYEDVNLYIDFNGGPRNVAVLIMGLSNLMKLRNATIKEITYMDFENKKKSPQKDPEHLDSEKKQKTDDKKEKNIISIENMDALFGCIDLVSGVNEYVNYGRIHILKNYFKDCEDQKIQMILRSLEDFSNNMQLCLTDYVMENKEKIKNALKQYQASARAGSSYEIMFSFVAEDILRGLGRLLEGTLPEIILWCMEKDFIQQALTFYIELLPAYLWNHRIFCPTMAEEQNYAAWRIHREYGFDSGSGHIPNTCLHLSRHMDDKYYWMHDYLLKDTKPDSHSLTSPEVFRKSGAERDACDTIDSTSVKPYVSNGAERDTCNSTMDSQSKDASQKTEYMLSLLTPGINRADTLENMDTDILRQILTDYFQIHSQRISSRYSTSQLGNTGSLWNYQEMYQALKKAAIQLRDLAKMYQ